MFCCVLFLWIHYQLLLNSCSPYTHILYGCFTGTGAIFRQVNIGLGNGLVPLGTKPLPEPMLTYQKIAPVPER